MSCSSHTLTLFKKVFSLVFLTNFIFYFYFDEFYYRALLIVSAFKVDTVIFRVHKLFTNKINVEILIMCSFSLSLAFLMTLSLYTIVVFTF
jgi:hypothetical protein